MNVNKSVYFSLHTTCQCTKIWSCSNSGFVQEALLTNMECSCKTPKWMFWFWFFKDHWQLHLQRSRWERRPPRGRERRPWGWSRGGPRGRPGGCFSLFWALGQGKALTFSWFSTTLTIAKTSYTQRQRQANGKLTIKWYHLLFWCPRRQINWQWQWAWTYEFSSNRPPNLPICYLKQL